MEKMKTISVAEYAKSLGVSPQVIYQRIATHKMVEGVDWVTERQERFLKKIIIKNNNTDEN